MNAIRWADRNLKSLGDFDAIFFDGRRWRSKTVHDQAARLASGLLALGIAPGDRVLLWLPNSVELVIAWRAVLRAGGVAVVAHRSAPLQQIRNLVTETRPTAIVSFAALDDASLGETVPHRIHVGPEESTGWLALSRLVAEYRPLRDPIERADDDIAVIQYTSGSTGTPKGVVTRHGALVATLENMQVKRFARWRRPIRHLALLPMSSSFGSLALYEGLGRKCTHFILDRFDPEEVLQSVQQHQIERVFLVPTMCEAILAVPNLGRFDLTSLQTVVCGGAIVTPALIERFKAALGIRLEVRYGMTGVGGVSRASPDSKAGSVGRPFSHLRAKVVDSQGEELPVGEIGELMLYLRKRTAIEYWNPVADTSSRDPEGWHRTGDLARFDAGGELYVVGRADDLIIQGGHNVYGESVAEIIRRLPEVKECAVVGVPSEFLGQEVVACVALRPGAELTAREIIAHCRTQLEALAAPTTVWFVDALPRNEAGKVKNFELRDTIVAARGGSQETTLSHRLAAIPPADRRAVLRQEVESMVGDLLVDSGAGITAPGSSFQEMGLDSLGAMELTHLLSEAIGRPLPATLVYSHPTIDAACDLLLDVMGFQGSSSTPSTARLPAIRLADPEECRLDEFLTPSDLAAAAALPMRDLQRDAAVVFLTGANGFLGRFIALEILSRLPVDGRLYCMVRAPSDAAAVQRFREAYRPASALQQLVDLHLASGRLIVFAGDVTRRHFGLPDEEYERLCAEVDCVVHNAAVVDHMLGYRDLFAPNVLGTVEIIRFGLASPARAINFVSTIATQRHDDAVPARDRARLAAGYVETKRASEKLLKEVHDRFGIPVRIYRPSYIMGHSDALGQINVQDTLTRLLHGITATSSAPRSFYLDGASAGDGYYDGLPVDAVARSVAALSLTGGIDRAGYVEYNIVNPHRDVGLDTIVKWVQSAGYRLERTDDYSEWYRTFKRRLNALSRVERQRSLLPLIHTWERPRGRGGIEHDNAAYRRDVAVMGQRAGTAPVEAPRITEAYIHKCVRDMQVLGLIDLHLP